MLLARLARLLSRPRRRGGEHNRLGDRGEDIAARFLRRQGYRVVARNWSCPAGEIDLVCYDGGTLVYIEVKSGTGEHAEPEIHVNAAKRRQVKRAAAAHRRHLSPEPLVRYDVVAIVFVEKAEPLVRHHVDAFA